MKKPEKKDIKDNFVEDVYCKSCRLSETFCQCKGYNQCWDEYEKFLPSEREILIMLTKSQWKIRAVIAKTLHKRIRGEK